MRRGFKRGLSPLVATVVLISATIVGGLVVYNYFQNSVDTVTSTSATLALYVKESYLTADTKLVYVQAVNLYDVPVNVTAVYAILPDGSHVQLTSSTTLPVTVEPGEKATIIAQAPANAAAIYLQYEVDGDILNTEPQTLG